MLFLLLDDRGVPYGYTTTESEANKFRDSMLALGKYCFKVPIVNLE